MQQLCDGWNGSQLHALKMVGNSRRTHIILFLVPNPAQVLHAMTSSTSTFLVTCRVLIHWLQHQFFRCVHPRKNTAILVLQNTCWRHWSVCNVIQIVTTLQDMAMNLCWLRCLLLMLLCAGRALIGAVNETRVTAGELSVVLRLFLFLKDEIASCHVSFFTALDCSLTD